MLIIWLILIALSLGVGVFLLSALITGIYIGVKKELKKLKDGGL